MAYLRAILRLVRKSLHAKFRFWVGDNNVEWYVMELQEKLNICKLHYNSINSYQGESGSLDFDITSWTLATPEKSLCIEKI